MKICQAFWRTFTYFFIEIRTRNVFFFTWRNNSFKYHLFCFILCLLEMKVGTFELMKWTTCVQLDFLWRKIESSRRVLRTSHKMTNWQNALGVSTITPKGVTNIIFLQVSVSDKINWLSHEFQNISPTSIRLFFQLVQLSDLYLPKTSCVNYNEKVASRLCWRDSAQ